MANRSTGRHQLRIEALEDRRVLTTLVINEFMASNSSTILDSDGNSSDWIEIHNPTAAPIDLTGMSLTDDEFDPQQWTFPNASLPAGEYMVIFASGQTTNDYVDPLGFLHTNFRLSAGGEYLGLTDANGNVIQEYAPNYPSQSDDISYGLDLTNQSTYFSSPTPGATNDFASAVNNQVQISEIMYHPAGGNAFDEYIEIYNGAAESIDVTGWNFDEGVEFTFPAVSLPSGGFLVVAADPVAFAAKYPSVTNFVGGWEGRLSNSSESIRLVDADGIPVDQVEYADQGEWAVRERGPEDFGHEGWQWSDAHDGLGSSLEVINFAVSNSFGQNWAASTVVDGTPGVANSVADDDGNIAPLIVGTTHSPAIPGSTDSVVITTRLIDEAATGVTASVRWRIDGTLTFNSAPLNDDGTGGDAVAADGIFSAEIPPAADGSIVEWFVTATDSTSITRRYPGASQPSGLQETNLLYQVDDSFDPSVTIAPDGQPEYRLIMTEVERAELEQIGSNATEGNSRAEMNGTFVSVSSEGVEVRYNVGIRNRGAGSRRRLPNSYRVNIPSDVPWQGIDQFNLNTQFTHLQLVGMEMFAEAGLLNEDAQPVLVQVNGNDLSGSGSPSYGVYMQIEALNSDYARNHFPEDSNGNLYRIVRNSSGMEGGDLRNLGSDPADYFEFYDKKTNSSENDYSDLIDLIQVLNTTPDDEYFKEVSKVVDVSQWLEYFAATAILNSRETSLGTGFGDDYSMYSGVNDPRFKLIPHDFDTILGQGDTNGEPDGSIYRALASPTVERFLTHPEIAPEYHGTLLRLLKTSFSKSKFDATIDRLLTDFVPLDVIDELIDFMDARREFIIGEVTQPTTVDSGLPSIGGFPRTNQDSVGLFGNATLANAQSVTVNGQLAELDPFTGEWNLGETGGGTNVSLLTTSHVWEYLDNGVAPSTDPGNDWRVDDPIWTDSGPSPLGYGDDHATTVDFVDTDPNTNGIQKNITTYFRTVLNVTDVNEFTSLTMDLIRDDGAIVYLNGIEVIRSNMPDGPIDETTVASSTVGGDDETTFFTFDVDPNLLVEGDNVIAVEIHQRAANSSDINFDLQLSGTRGDATSSDGLPLNPGVNRILVETFDDIEGTGELLDTAHYSVWYDDGDTVAVPASITTDTTWTAADGPYVVTSDLTVSGGTLSIEPGTSVMFDPGVEFRVTGAGTVNATGEKYNRVQFSNNPAVGSGHWDGLTVVDTPSDNQFTYVDFHSGDADGEATLVDAGRAILDNVAWPDTDNQVLDLYHPTLIVRNSHIPGIGGDETIHLVGLDTGEQLEFIDNIIGKNTSGGDVVDMAPDSLDRQTIYFRGNTFLGGFDDGIDTDGSIVVFENNTFFDFHLETSRTTTSNAISSGHQNVGATTLSSDLTIFGNKFYDVDHAVLLKDFSYANIVNNTIVNATIGGIQFQELSGSNVIGPGLGADLDGNIFWETPLVFEAIHPDTQLTVNRSIVTADLVGDGVGNLAVDPLLADPANGDFSLLENSPAFFLGPNGTDIGAVQAPRHTPADMMNLRITEVHYNPLDGSHLDAECEVLADGDWFEFIELYNPTDDILDLSNVAFVDGIEFAFPWQTFMQPGEVMVLVKNLDVFESRYGSDINVVGEYDGKLANGGETIELVAADGSKISRFTYGDSGDPGWPAAPDGSGSSLQVVDIDGDYDEPGNWTNGTTNGGSPGVFTEVLPDCDLDGDGLCDCSDIDELQAAIVAGVYDAAYDLNSDGVLDVFDRDQWLTDAGAMNLASGNSYAPGDGNLDGFVDASDFNIWNGGKFTTNSAWCSGDFNVDGVVDASDFNIWNANKFTAQGPAPVGVAPGSTEAAGRTISRAIVTYEPSVADNKVDNARFQSQLQFARTRGTTSEDRDARATRIRAAHIDALFKEL